MGTPKRIRITGGSGSGKTYLAQKLAKETGIQFYSLDRVFYDFTDTHRFEVKRPIPKVNKILKEILKNKEWIMDGSWYTRTKETYDKSDILILLVPSFTKRISNTIKRFFQRIKEGKYEGILNFLSLTKYNLSTFNKWGKARHVLFKKEYEQKLHVFRSADRAFDWFKEKNTKR